MKSLVQLPFDPVITDPTIDPVRGIVPAFTRDSGATSEDIQGNTIYTGNNGFRWSKFGTKRYLKLEPTSINLLVDKSEDFRKWTLDGTVVVYAKTQAAPDGDLDGDEIVFSTTTGQGASITGLGNQASKTLTLSCWIKSASGTPNVRLQFISNSTYTSVKALTTGWVRYTFTQALTSGDTTSLTVKLASDDTSAPTIHVFGAQLEEQPLVTSYIVGTSKILVNPNLVIDGDLDLDNLDGWTSFNSPTSFAKNNTVVKFGLRSLKIVTAGDNQGVSQVITTVIGATYFISGWLNRFAGSGTPYLEIQGQVASLAAQAVDGWQYIEIAFKATGTTHTLLIRSAGTCSFYADKVSMILQSSPEPSFEASGTPPAPWAMVAGGTYSVESSIVHGGAKAAKITCAAAGDGIEVSQTNLSLVNTTWYRLSAWMYIVSQSVGTVFPQITAHANFNITTQNAKSVVGSWQRVTCIFRTGTLVGSNTIQFKQTGTGTLVFLLDDIAITQLENISNTRLADNIYVSLRNNQPSNILLYSEDFSNVAWQKIGSSVVTPNTVIAPDGNLTADLLYVPKSTGFVIQQLVPKPSTTYSFSVWLRSRGISSNEALYFYISDGVSDIAAMIVTPTPVWRRFFVAGTSAASPGSLMSFGFHNVWSGVQKDVNVLAWGAQLEETSATVFGPSSYIKTSSLAIAIRFTGGFGSANLNRKSGSVSFWVVVPWANQTGSFSHVFGDSITDILAIEDAGSGNENWQLRISGVDKTGTVLFKTISIPATSSLSSTSEHHIVVTWNTDRDSTGKMIQSRVRIYINGTRQVDQTYTDIQEWFYNSSFFRISDGTVLSNMRALQIWPNMMTDSEVTDLYVNS